MLKTNKLLNTLIKFNINISLPDVIFFNNFICFEYIGNYCFKINEYYISLFEINDDIDNDSNYLIEIFYDYNKYTYFSINGYTKKIPERFNFSNITLSNKITNYQIINNINYPIINNQLITDDSPRLLIFSAHNIRNSESEITSKYDVTINRLDKLFTKLISKNYQPITWNQIIDWKINNIHIPKFSFAIMIDDFPVDVYIDKNKRAIFDKFNVKPGLAIVLPSTIDSHDIIIDGKYIDQTFLYNNIKYSRKDILKEISDYGWFLACHLDHRKIELDDTSNMYLKFQNDINIATAYGLNTNIIVYPYGSINIDALKILKTTNFKLGVHIHSSGKYNCKASNNYFLTRISLNNDIPLDTIFNMI